MVMWHCFENIIIMWNFREVQVMWHFLENPMVTVALQRELNGHVALLRELYGHVVS